MNRFFVDRTYEFDTADIQENRIFAGLSYLWLLFLLPLFVCPRSRFAKFHANQGLLLFVLEAVINLLFTVAIKIVGIIPFLGWIFAVILGLIQGIINLILLVLVIYCLVKTLYGHAIEIPVIGKITIIK